MASAKKPPSLMDAMGGGGDEGGDIGPDMDRAAMQRFIDAVKAGDATKALDAWDALPAPGGMGPMEE